MKDIKIYNKVIKEVMAVEYALNDTQTYKRTGERYDVDSKKIPFLFSNFRGWARRTDEGLHMNPKVEDAFQDALLYFLIKAKKNELIKDFSFKSIIYKMRKLLFLQTNKENGLNVAGKKYKHMVPMTLVTIRDEFGNDKIEDMAYDENGEVIIGT